MLTLLALALCLAEAIVVGVVIYNFYTMPLKDNPDKKNHSGHYHH